MDFAAILRLVLSCLASLILTYVLGAIAARIKVRERNERRWAKEEKSRFGGGALLIAVVLGLSLTEKTSLVLAPLGIAAVGMIDDLRPLPIISKLLLQIIGAATVPLFSITFYVTDNPVLDVSFTILWVLIMTNALNILDNIDGLAASVAAISLLLFSIYSNQLEYALITISGCVGFLLLNWHPAKIFLGDAGSHFLGVSIAIQGIITTNGALDKAQTLFLLIAGSGIALFDFLFVIWTRIRSGRSPWQGGKDHSSHRLVNLGISTRLSVTILIIAHVCMIITGVLVFHAGFPLRMFLLSTAGIGLCIGYRILKSAPIDYT